MANHNVDNSVNNRADKSKPHRPLALTSPKQRQGGYFEQQACEFL